MQVTIEELLQAEIFNGSRVIAGEKGLSNQVSSLNILDSYRGYAFSEKGMFAITSGYFLSQDPDRQADMVEQLAKRGIAGMALKPIYFDGKVPEKILQTADRLDFPVIALGNDSSAFRDFFTFFATQVYARGAHEYLSREKVSAVLIQLMHEEGLLGLARQLYAWTDKPVTAQFRAAPYNFPESKSAFRELLAGYEAERRMRPSKNHLDLLEISPPFAGLGVAIDCKSEPLCMVWLDAEKSALDENDAIFLRAAKLACELEIQQILFIEQSEERMRTGFVEKLLTGSLKGMSDALLLSKRIRWRIPDHMFVVLIHCDEIKPMQSPIKIETSEYFRCHKLFIPVHTFDQYTVILFPSDTEDGPQLLDGLQKHLADAFPGKRILFGIGRSMELQEAQVSFHQASFALDTGKRVLPDQSIYIFDKMGLFRICCSVLPREELMLFCRELLQPLLKSESASKLDLLQTLCVYFHTGGNFSRTGQILHIHPNTVRYRLEVVERLCHVRFDSYNEVLALQVSIALLPAVFPEYVPLRNSKVTNGSGK